MVAINPILIIVNGAALTLSNASKFLAALGFRGDFLSKKRRTCGEGRHTPLTS
jgi:hypothetical protein